MARVAYKARMRAAMPASEAAGHIFYSTEKKFKASAITSAAHLAVKMKRKSNRAKDRVARRQKKMWRKFQKAMATGGVQNFNVHGWLHDHHDPKGRVAYKRRRAEERARRARAVPPELPTLKPHEEAPPTMAPFIEADAYTHPLVDKDIHNDPAARADARRKRPMPAKLLPLPTPMGRTNYEAIMGKYENFQDAMLGLREKTAAKVVSKDFFRFVLAQERRMREAAERRKKEEEENQRRLHRALMRLKHKQMSGAFHAWVDTWDTLKRMRALMQRVAGGTKSGVFARWVRFRITSREERMDAYGALAEYAIVIQSWVRGWIAMFWTDRHRIECAAAKPIHRMVRAHFARNILTRARAQKAREEALRRRVRNRLVLGVQHRVFEAWAEWAHTSAALRRFVKKHMLGGVAKALHAWVEGTQVLKSEREDARRLQAFMQKHMVGGLRKGWLAWRDAHKNARLLRNAKNRLMHGALVRVWTAWAGQVATTKRVTQFLRRWKNKEVHAAFHTWHETAHREVRLRHLARRLFLGAAQKAFEGWKMIWLEELRKKHIASRKVQGLYWVWFGKNFLKRARAQVAREAHEARMELKARGEDSERHRMLRIDPTDPQYGSRRLKMLHEETVEAMGSSTGYFDSKTLHDHFDMRNPVSGNFVMSSLRDETTKETLRLAQRRRNVRWYRELSARERKKWGRRWEQNHKYSADDQIRRESIDVRTLHDHFPTDGNGASAYAGKSMVFQGTFQDFEAGLRNSMAEWKFMHAQGWIGHAQYIQWIVRGAVTNVADEEKRIVGWNIVKELLDENTFAEVVVCLGNNEIVEVLGGRQRLATQFMVPPGTDLPPASEPDKDIVEQLEEDSSDTDIEEDRKHGKHDKHGKHGQHKHAEHGQHGQHKHGQHKHGQHKHGKHKHGKHKHGKKHMHHENDATTGKA